MKMKIQEWREERKEGKSRSGVGRKRGRAAKGSKGEKEILREKIEV